MQFQLLAQVPLQGNHSSWGDLKLQATGNSSVLYSLWLIHQGGARLENDLWSFHHLRPEVTCFTSIPAERITWPHKCKGAEECSTPYALEIGKESNIDGRWCAYHKSPW